MDVNNNYTCVVSCLGLSLCFLHLFNFVKKNFYAHTDVLNARMRCNLLILITIHAQQGYVFGHIGLHVFHKTAKPTCLVPYWSACLLLGPQI